MNEEIKENVNNKKLEVKNTVYLYNNEIEKLEKINLEKFKLYLVIITILLGSISYIKEFIGLSFILFIIFIILTIIIFIIDIYAKKRIVKLKHRIKELEQFFLVLESKK